MKNDIIHVVQGDDGWWTDHHHFTSTHSQTLPLYLAPPRLDLRHTHIHPWWGEVSPQPRKDEREEGDKVRSCLQVCCSLLPPLSSIYSAETTSWDQCEHSRNGPGANQEPPCGGRSLAAIRSILPTCGVSRPLVGPSGGEFSPSGCQVGPQGDSGCPRGLEAVLMRRRSIESMWRFRGGSWFVGSSSHGLMTSWIQWTPTWQPSIGWAWIDWLMEVYFLLISCAKYLHSSLHCH
jgi:hypothetical protein